MRKNPLTLENVYISAGNGDELDIGSVKTMNIIQAMNYLLYSLQEDKILNNECPIICNYLIHLAQNLTGEERQTLKNHLHLYENSKVAWRSTIRLRKWAIIDTTTRIYIKSLESRAIRSSQYGVMKLIEESLSNNFISSVNLGLLAERIKNTSSLVDNKSETANDMKECSYSISRLIETRIDNELDYAECAKIIGISLDYANDSANLMKMVELLLSRIIGLNSMDSAKLFAMEMTMAGNKETEEADSCVTT